MEMLNIGSTGPDVELLHTALIRAGYYQGTPGNVFDSPTFRAVLLFQGKNGLREDGVVGPLTWGALTPYLTGYVYHEIRQNDTLFMLAREYNTSIDAILTANPGINPYNLIPGTFITIPLGFPVVPTNISFTYTVLNLCVDGLTARYPFLRQRVIGNSVGGRSLYALSAGDGANQVLYNASHHANEWITTPVLMRFLEDYAAAYAADGAIFGYSAQDIFARTTINIVPMVNPDGVDLVTGAIPPGSLLYNSAQAMNYLKLPFPDAWKANIRGVDLNVNYPANWELAREIKFSRGYTQPGPRDYPGPAPLSEPENGAMAHYTRLIDPSLTLAYHTQGEIIFWRYMDFLPPKSYEIARLFSAVSGYAVEDTPGDSHAGYKDWFIMEYNRPGYTIECGMGVNPLPISQFNKIYEDNIGILTLAAIV